MTYCISFSSCCVCGPLVNKENLPKNHQPLKDALLLMREKILKSGTPVKDLFRKDRKGNHGGVAVFVHDELVATRRDDLELDTVEGMWLEIAVPKSRSFLVGNFYRPGRTSPYYDKDFMFKLNGIFSFS